MRPLILLARRSPSTGLLNLRSGNATGGSNPLPSAFPRNLSTFLKLRIPNHDKKVQNIRFFRVSCRLFVAFFTLIWRASKGSPNIGGPFFIGRIV